MWLNVTYEEFQLIKEIISLNPILFNKLIQEIFQMINIYYVNCNYQYLLITEVHVN